MKVFVTGASSGIGRKLVKQLVRTKHEVWVIARRSHMLELLKNEVGTKNFRFSQCDLESLEDMKRVAAEMENADFLPNIVVLNAGVNLQNPSNVFDLALYQKTFDINLGGAMFWVSEFIPKFIARNSGHFVAICSTSAFRHGYGGISYSASKAALALTFRRLRVHFAKTGIKFSTLYFGPIDTEMFRWRSIKFLVPSADRAGRFIAGVFNKRGGEYYFPFFTTMLSRLTLFFPEQLFIFFSKHLTEKNKGD